MPGTERRWIRAGSLLCLALLGLGAAGARAQFVAQLVQMIDADEREDHVNVSIQFACSVRYITHTPASHGSSVTVQLRLGADCGAGLRAIPPELPIIGGTSKLVTTARLESAAPGDVTLTLSLQRALDFVLTPTTDSRGLRVRLLRALQPKTAQIVVGDASDAPEGYAINLDSSRQQFDPDAIQDAVATLQTRVYVSETDVDATHWFRLRAGPYRTRAEAEKVLQAVRSRYPQAWLGINDESDSVLNAAIAGNQPKAVATAGPSDPPLADAERARILHDARAAMDKRDFNKAIEALTLLLRQPEYAQRAEAQELMGLARQRNGQLAHAKAEYEEYLSRYPNGAAAERIRTRLKALGAAGRQARSVGEFGGARATGWDVTGAASQIYQRGQDQVTSGGISTNTTSLNSLLTSADVLARHRGERFDFIARATGSYNYDMLNSTSTTGVRRASINAFDLQLADRQSGVNVALGRLAQGGVGDVGLFQGLAVTWDTGRRLTLRAAAGVPLDSGYSTNSSSRKFQSLSVEYGPYQQAWTFGTFVFNQSIEGSTDRRAIGIETRYFRPGRTAVVLVDYDTALHVLNSATLIGNLQLPDKWTAGFDMDHRRTPSIALRNALIGQPVTDLTDLRTLFTDPQIQQLALDRTALTDSWSLSLSRPIGERWQFMSALYASRTGATPASGGVVATPATGLDKSVQLTVSGSGLWVPSDLQFFGFRYEVSPIQRSETLSWNGRFPIVGAWRAGPRFSIENLNSSATQSSGRMYLPELRADWTGKRAIMELTIGDQVQQETQAGQTQNAKRLYLSGGYRLRF